MKKITEHPISWGIGKRLSQRNIKLLVVHTMYNPEVDKSERFSLEPLLAILKKYDVAPHYIILRSGAIYQLAPDSFVMNHAGKSKTTHEPEKNNVNDFSLGVELASGEDTRPTDEQYRALAWLLHAKERSCPAIQPVGHDAIAWPPGRKSDPWNFDWGYFYQLFNKMQNA